MTEGVMSPVSEPAIAVVRESTDAVLAKNLVIARAIAGITQTELADLSNISRATIAQIETGSSDPRLTTIVQLARAIGIPPILLLIGLEEAQALAALLDVTKKTTGATIDSRQVARMRQHVATGMLKDRLRAAMIGAAAVEPALEKERLARVSAAIFSAFVPGTGTQVGALLGKLLAESNSAPACTTASTSHVKEKS
jgi:transcriptional regulator with XRE-family HTH domain